MIIQTDMFDNDKLNARYNKKTYFIILDCYFTSFALNIPVNINIWISNSQTCKEVSYTIGI